MVFKQVQHKPGRTVTEADSKLEISDLSRRGIVLSKALICVFVFAYAVCWFSHEAAHIVYNCIYTLMSFAVLYDIIINLAIPTFLASFR